MTTDQWITAGIPLAAVIIGVFRNEFALSSVERHVSGKVESLEKVMNSRFAEVNYRIDSLEKVMNARFEVVDQRFAAAHEGLLRVEGNLDARLKHLEER